MEEVDFHDAIWDAPIITSRNRFDTIMGRILDEMIDNIDEYESLPIQGREQNPCTKIQL